MTYLLEFYDSEVISVTSKGTECSIDFSAAHVRTLPSKREGYLSCVRIHLDGVTTEAIEPGSFGRLQQGSWLVEGSRHRSIEIPLHTSQAVALELSFANGNQFTCTATSATITFEGGEFVESLKC